MHILKKSSVESEEAFETMLHQPIGPAHSAGGAAERN